MVTWVMVVSFMFALPLLGAGPLRAASPLLRTPPPRSDTASRISLRNFPGRRSSAIRQHEFRQLRAHPDGSCDWTSPTGARYHLPAPVPLDTPALDPPGP